MRPRSRQRLATSTSAEKQCMTPPTSSTRSSARSASVSGCASRQWMMTGFRTRRAIAIWRRKTRSCTSRGERLRKKSRPISPSPTTRAGSRARRSISSKSASVASAASCGMNAHRGPDIRVPRSARATAARLDSRSVPMVTMPRSPAARARSSTRVQILGEVREVQMRVGVEERHQARSGSTFTFMIRGLPCPARSSDGRPRRERRAPTAAPRRAGAG